MGAVAIHRPAPKACGDSLAGTADRMAESQCSTPDEQPRPDDARLERSRPEAVGSSTSPCGRCLTHPMPRHGKKAALKPQAERRRAGRLQANRPDSTRRMDATPRLPSVPNTADHMAAHPLCGRSATPTSSRLLRWAWALSPSSPCRAQAIESRGKASRGTARGRAGRRPLTRSAAPSNTLAPCRRFRSRSGTGGPVDSPSWSAAACRIEFPAEQHQGGQSVRGVREGKHRGTRLSTSTITRRRAPRHMALVTIESRWERQPARTPRAITPQAIPGDFPPRPDLEGEPSSPHDETDAGTVAPLR